MSGKINVCDNLQNAGEAYKDKCGMDILIWMCSEF